MRSFEDFPLLPAIARVAIIMKSRIMNAVLPRGIIKRRPMLTKRCKMLSYQIMYGSASGPNIRCGFRAATSNMACANTEFAHANHGPAAEVSNRSHGICKKEHSLVVSAGRCTFTPSFTRPILLTSRTSSSAFLISLSSSVVKI